MEGTGPAIEGKEGVYQYLNSRAASSKKPFFLVISLINPHDVLFYPANFAASTYPESMLLGDSMLPKTYNESLVTKPRAQIEWATLNKGARVFCVFFILRTQTSDRRASDRRQST
jgi:hypothetical protein